MKNKSILISVLLIVTLTSCTKDKLVGGDTKFEGTWKWFATTGGFGGGGFPRDPGYNRTIEIFDTGKYKYSSSTMEIGNGVLFMQDDLYTFKNLQSFGNDEISGKSILMVRGDTILIGEANVADGFQDIFIKK